MTAKEAIREMLDVISDDEADDLWRRMESEFLAPLTAAERERVDRSLSQLTSGERIREDEVFAGYDLD